MIEPYASMAGSLEPHGITAQLKRADQLVISRQIGPVWPDRGNSFWLSHAQDQWYISTWAPACHAVPDSSDVVELCIDFMRSGDRAAFVLPEELIAKYRLSPRLTPAEYEALFGEP